MYTQLHLKATCYCKFMNIVIERLELCIPIGRSLIILGPIQIFKNCQQLAIPFNPVNCCSMLLSSNFSCFYHKTGPGLGALHTHTLTTFLRVLQHDQCRARYQACLSSGVGCLVSKLVIFFSFFLSFFFFLYHGQTFEGNKSILIFQVKRSQIFTHRQ